MAVLVFYGGTGINIISYCCNECRSVGISVLKNEKCCDIHHHHHANPASDCNENTDIIHHRHDHTCIHNAVSGCCDEHAVDSTAGIGHECNDFCDVHAHGDFCSLERIQFDWNSSGSSHQETGFSPLPLTLFSCYLVTHSPFDIILTGHTISPVPHGPPTVLPHDYLSMLTVLLI